MKMRFSPTLSEAWLWQALRGSPLGAVFRQQAVLRRSFTRRFLKYALSA
jgi:hypothetical protein